MYPSFLYRNTKEELRSTRSTSMSRHKYVAPHGVVEVYT